MSSRFVEAYIGGAARPFLRRHLRDAGDRRAAVQAAARPLSPAVARALVAQNARFQPSAARDGHLAALAGGAAAVVTGQQVGLFLGPLYTTYKAASAIVLARVLAAETGRPVVPVFWLQTEDHDLPEIASCRISRAGSDVLELALPADAADRTSIAHRTLPDGVAVLLDRLHAELAHLPGGEAHSARLVRQYRPGAGWADAFAGVLADLFAPEGLVIFDPRDPALAAAAAPVHARALLRAGPIAEALTGRVRELEAAGFDAQVRVREGAPLSFFHPDGAKGPRYRLTPAGHGYACSGRSGGEAPFTTERLLEALEADPLAFSTSALLRPILQDTLLPTAAYVGGPAEVAYFAQLAPLYAEFGLPEPLVVPRASFRVIDDRAERVLARHGLVPADAAVPEDALLARCRTGAAPAAEADLVRGLVGPFEAALDTLAPALQATGPGIDAAIAKTRGKVRDAVEKLAAKLDAARLHADGALVGDVRRLQRLLYPDGMPQERYYGLASFAARLGERTFLERVLEAVDPLDPAPRDLR
ncbi:MAG: bacillithiol biosynthesis cysteine-adding enzyme BshC [Acidobacteria bacterium]|nr:bacillithiol biosynthesis cysteine-adding enzyme BshC [Acidobacteriota bacterium]